MAAEGDAQVVESWLHALEARQLRDLTFAEVRRALQALSSLYVERRQRIASGAAFDGRGKRAAFALYYGPLHFLAVREVVRNLHAARPAPTRIVDLGCGTGVGGAAWALEAGAAPRVEAVDQSGWAVAETRWTLQQLGLRGDARRCGIERARLPRSGEAALAAYTLNELAEQERGALLEPLLAAARAGAQVLVVEPIARRVAPWWGGWREAFLAAGGRDDEWRFRVALPDAVARLDRATRLDHRELTARSLYLAGAS
jgi:ribosomal protein RSM22 (predicted rRNA methylase)